VRDDEQSVMKSGPSTRPSDGKRSVTNTLKLSVDVALPAAAGQMKMKWSDFSDRPNDFLQRYGYGRL